MKSNIFTLLSLFIVLISCKKPSDPSTKDLIGKTWKVESLTVNTAPNSTIDFSSYRFTFNPNGTATITTDGTQSGPWTLSSDEKTILVNAGAANEIMYSIKEVSSNRLVLETTLKNYKTQNNTLVYTLIPA